MVRIWPGENIDLICDRVTTNPALRKVLDAAIEATEEERTLSFNPPSQIQKQVRQGYKVSYNLAFLSVEEVTEIAGGIPPSGLKLESASTTLRIENGARMTGFLFSPVGLDDEIWKHCRKVEVFLETALDRNDVFLLPQEQLAQCQAGNLWTYLTSAELQKRAAVAKGLTSKTEAITVTKLKEEMQKVQNERAKQENPHTPEDDNKGYVATKQTDFSVL